MDDPSKRIADAKNVDDINRCYSMLDDVEDDISEYMEALYLKRLELGLIPYDQDPPLPYIKAPAPNNKHYRPVKSSSDRWRRWSFWRTRTPDT